MNPLLDTVYANNAGVFFPCNRDATSLLLSSGTTQPAKGCNITLTMSTQLVSTGCAFQPMYVNAYEDELTSLVLSMDILPDYAVLNGSSVSLAVPPTAFFEADGGFVAYIVSASTQGSGSSRRRCVCFAVLR